MLKELLYNNREMTPRSPPGSKARPIASITGNIMDKFVEEKQDVWPLYATSVDPNHPVENVLV